MIRADRLGVRVGARDLLTEVDVHLEPGTLTAVLGPNGAGKSTLMACLSGERAPTSGSVCWGEQELHTYPVAWLARRRAVMTQRDDLVFPFTVAEVVLLGRHPHHAGWPSAHDRRVAAAAQSALGIEELHDRIYPSCSGGERARIQMARALAQIWEPIDDDGRVLLLDEPTAALDLAHQHRSLALLRRIAHEDGIAMLVVLHHLELVAAYADRVVIMADGCVAAAGPTAAVFQSDLLSHVFGLPIAVEQDPAGHLRCFAQPMV